MDKVNLIQFAVMRETTVASALELARKADALYTDRDIYVDVDKVNKYLDKEIGDALSCIN